MRSRSRSRRSASRSPRACSPSGSRPTVTCVAVERAAVRARDRQDHHDRQRRGGRPARAPGRRGRDGPGRPGGGHDRHPMPSPRAVPAAARQPVAAARGRRRSAQRTHELPHPPSPAAAAPLSTARRHAPGRVPSCEPLEGLSPAVQRMVVEHHLDPGGHRGQRQGRTHHQGGRAAPSSTTRAPRPSTPSEPPISGAAPAAPVEATERRGSGRNPAASSSSSGQSARPAHP